MRRLSALLGGLALIAGLTIPPAAAGPAFAVDPDDDAVTGRPYVRHDGGIDTAIEECNDGSTNPAPDDDPNDIDSDSNDGGNRRQGNEPFSVVDPTDPETVVAGWNDYCQTDIGAGWEGFAYSRDGGESWTDSIVPGYPSDTSEEGQESPLFGNHTDAGDPIAAFNNAGDLYVGGIAFNRSGAINGDVFVSTYATTPPACAATTCPGYPVDYLRTVVVGKGTPSRNFQGIFQDKPMLEVDRTGGSNDGNVYVCWSRFTGFGQNKIYFSRSTDGGATFSRPLTISRSSEVKSVQGCDIAVEHDGDVYVTFRTFDAGSPTVDNGVAFVRSTDGGQSFSRSRMAVTFTPYFPFDSSRDCGDGAELCPTGYVFHRVPLEPRVTADQDGTLDGVYITYNAIDPATVEPSETSYSSADAGEVGQSRVYVAGSTDDGRSWSPNAVDTSDPNGHQYFPDVDALDGVLAVVWQDSRTDPCYDVQLPFGNTSDATSCGLNVVNTFVSHSTDGSTFAGGTKVSDVGHQPQYEMFGNRSVPFQGDYSWVSLAHSGDGLFGYVSWTDNRDVVPGADPREAEEDGFDVLQCRAENPDGTFGSDTCPNAGGLDQNIYGNSVTF